MEVNQIDQPSEWYNRTFNIRGALGGFLIGGAAGVIPAVILGFGESINLSLITWVICIVFGIAIGLKFIKPTYPTLEAAKADSLTYKRFGLYLVLVFLYYLSYGLLASWIDSKTAGLSAVIGGAIVTGLVRWYMKRYPNF